MMDETEKEKQHATRQDNDNDATRHEAAETAPLVSVLPDSGIK